MEVWGWVEFHTHIVRFLFFLFLKYKNKAVIANALTSD